MTQEEIPKPKVEEPPATLKHERYGQRIVDLERLVRGMEKYIAELKAEIHVVSKDRDELAALITEDALVNEGISAEDNREEDSDVPNSDKKQANKYKHLALFDERTGVKSRLGFERLARLTIGHQMKRLQDLKELEKAEPGLEVKNTETLTFIMVDLDYFKKINDTYGHPAGDEAMRKVGETLRHSIRGRDFAGRWGGDEFILCITSKGESDSRMVAERIRNAIADIVFDVESTRIPMSASIGVVNWEEGDTLEEMVDRADKAQYIAKRAGRNQVIAEVRQGRGKDRTSFYMFEGNDELIPKVEVQEYLQTRAAK